MNKLLFFIAAAIIANFSHASGLGWYVQSFDWAKYEADRGHIDASVKECITTNIEEKGWCGEREIVKRFIGVRGQKATSLVTYDVKEVVLPLNFEYFDIALFREAYELQPAKNMTLFGLFKNGRSEWSGQLTGCEAYPEMSWNCTNAYVLMRPKEVRALMAEIDNLPGKKSFVKYEYFQQDLQVLKKVVDTAVKENRALLFYAQD